MDWKSEFDWAGALKRNSEALIGIVAALFAMLGDATAERIPQTLHLAVLRILRPAESAVRRLIVIAARGVVVKLSPSRPLAKGKVIGKGEGSRIPAFKLYDTRKYYPELNQHRIRYAKHPPRILFLNPESKIDDLWARPQPKARPAPDPDGLVNAARLTRRLQALRLALEDLPHQALRMARWRARREAITTPVFKSPLRPGPPPGRRKRHLHPIDEILDNLHGLAWEALKPDTS